MDITQILIAAGLGAIGAGFGVLIGRLLGKFLPEKYQSVLPAFFAVLGVALSQLANDAIKERRYESAIIAEFEKQPVFIQIAKNFPDEAAQFKQEMIKVRDRDAAFQLGYNFTTRLRKTYANFSRSSSDEAIKSYLDNDRALTLAIKEGAGKKSCANYLALGPATLPQGMDAYMDDMTKTTNSLFVALADGRDSGTDPRPEPAPEDWDAFITYWRSEGATDEMVEAFVTPNSDNLTYCDSYASFLATVMSYPANSGESLRANLVYYAAIAD